jgi:hypothetical protein
LGSSPPPEEFAQGAGDYTVELWFFLAIEKTRRAEKAMAFAFMNERLASSTLIGAITTASRGAIDQDEWESRHSPEKIGLGTVPIALVVFGRMIVALNDLNRDFELGRLDS